MGTEGLLLVVVAELLSYQPLATSEPPLKAYTTDENKPDNRKRFIS